jgi:hypothetical protein
MASKKKSKKKSAKLKKAAGKKSTPAKKLAKKQPTKRTARKAGAKKKVAPKKPVAKQKAAKKDLVEKPDVSARVTQRSRPARRAPDVSSDMLGPDSGGQSGDLQGLTDVEGADSESVDELVEEGNAFEAGIISGVEDAGRRGDREVRTREVPEDDVPQEYLDEE